jgi:hypothetical protein
MLKAMPPEEQLLRQSGRWPLFGAGARASDLRVTSGARASIATPWVVMLRSGQGLARDARLQARGNHQQEII